MLVPQFFLSTNFYYLHHFFSGDGIEPPPFQARVHKSFQTHMGNGGPAGGNVAHHMGQHSLGQVVGFNLVIHGQLAHLGRQVPVAGNIALYQALMGQTIGQGIIAVAMGGAGYQSKIPGFLIFEKILFQRVFQVIGGGAGTKTFTYQSIAVFYQPENLLRA